MNQALNQYIAAQRIAEHKRAAELTRLHAHRREQASPGQLARWWRVSRDGSRVGRPRLAPVPTDGAD